MSLNFLDRRLGMVVGLLAAGCGVAAPAQTVIVDNNDAGFQVLSGSWSPSANAGFWGTNSLINFVTGPNARVRWTPSLPGAGVYQVSAWWVAAGNRPTDAKYEIFHRDGVAVVPVNQTGSGSQWVSLGEFPFDGDATPRVELSSNVTTGEYVSADAVRFVYTGPAEENACPLLPTALMPLTGPGCGGCGGLNLPGTLTPSPHARWAIHSDLPEAFGSPGVLYATIPTLPPANDERTPELLQQINNGFPGLNDDFEIFIFHISRPGDGSAPRRVVVYTRNDGPEAVTIAPRQIMITQGVVGNVHEMESNLGRRVLAEQWDTPLASVTLQPGEGRAIAWSNAFSGFGAGIDANINCFGMVRAAVAPAAGATAEPMLSTYVVGIPNTSVGQINNTVVNHLAVSATSEDSVNLGAPVSGCQLSRATGVFEAFIWRNAPVVFDAARLTPGGTNIQMALSKVQASACPQGAQTASLVLRPGYAPADTVGNYMVEYRLDLTLVNSDSVPRGLDIRFGKSGADIGLAWQSMVSPSPVPDATLAARDVRTGWAGPNQSGLTRSFLTEDGGPITLPPCSTRTLSMRFMVLGNSSLPFQISLEPAAAGSLPPAPEAFLMY